MSEITDLVLPILQGMQADMADIKRDVTTLKEVQGEHTGRFESLEIMSAYETGLGAQNKVDVTMLKARIKAVEERLASLTPQA